MTERRCNARRKMSLKFETHTAPLSGATSHGFFLFICDCKKREKARSRLFAQCYTHTRTLWARVGLKRQASDWQASNGTQLRRVVHLQVTICPRTGVWVCVQNEGISKYRFIKPRSSPGEPESVRRASCLISILNSRCRSLRPFKSSKDSQVRPFR